MTEQEFRTAMQRVIEYFIRTGGLKGLHDVHPCLVEDEVLDTLRKLP